MKTKIKIHTDSTGFVPAFIDNSLNPSTAKEILKALPITSSAQLWGDEIYFSIPVSMSEESARVEVNVGDLAYWPPGNSFCIFFGRTPASQSDKPAAASAVNVFGYVEGDSSLFRKVKNGETITISLDDD